MADAQPDSSWEGRDGGFEVKTRYAASADALYAAWTTVEGMQGWLAGTAEVDPRPGGRYVLRFDEEGSLSARGEFVELVPGRRLVMTWESWGPQGRLPDGDARVQVEFTDAGGGTTEMSQREWSDAYSQPQRVEMSAGGTIQAHEALRHFVERTDG